MKKLSEISTKAPKEFDKKDTREKTAILQEELAELQNVMYAEGKHAVLIILQGLDASGKDGAIRKVFSNINPQGIAVASFKTPTPEELGHDFIWRLHKVAPQKGMMQIFNRSHYEDVLITRVHGWCDDATAKKRFSAINNFEKLLKDHNSTQIFKFYLHISADEQQERLQERLEDKSKQWKYNAKDFAEASHWDDYMKMYEDIFENCNDIPWTIVPSDQNWFKEYTIAQTLVDGLKSLHMKYPDLEEKAVKLPE